MEWSFQTRNPPRCGWRVPELAQMGAQEYASHQLGRMRAMVGMYHRLFFRDVRVAMALVVLLLGLGWWVIPEMFLVVPFVCLWAATQTAFDASYLIMARHYAAALETFLNENGAEGVLVGAMLEDTYLFPLDTRKIVTVPIGGQFSWFSFMTVFIAANGVWAMAVGLWAGWGTLLELGHAARLTYLVVLGSFVTAALATGLWWFVGRVGERRLQAVLSARFGRPSA